MFENLNLGNLSGALKATGSDYQVPPDAWGTAPASQPAAGFQMPSSVNDALAASGSSYRVNGPGGQPTESASPDWLGKAQQAQSMLKGGAQQEQQAPDDGAVGDPEEPSGMHGIKNIQNSKIMGIAKAVASFYTGGLASAAGSVASSKGGKGGQAAGAADSAGLMGNGASGAGAGDLMSKIGGFL